MEPLIEPYAPHHREAIVRLSLRAWAPVFESLKNVMDGEVHSDTSADLVKAYVVWFANR